MTKTTKKKIKKKNPQVCIELKDGKVICFGGTMDGMGCFIDLIGMGEIKIKSVRVPIKTKKK